MNSGLSEEEFNRRHKAALELMQEVFAEMVKEEDRFGDLLQKYYDESRPWWLPKFLDRSLNSASRVFAPRCEEARARAFMETHTPEEYSRATEKWDTPPPMDRYVSFDWKAGLS